MALKRGMGPNKKTLEKGTPKNTVPGQQKSQLCLGAVPFGALKGSLRAPKGTGPGHSLDLLAWNRVFRGPYFGPQVVVVVFCDATRELNKNCCFSALGSLFSACIVFSISLLIVARVCFSEMWAQGAFF